MNGRPIPPGCTAVFHGRVSEVTRVEGGGSGDKPPEEGDLCLNRQVSLFIPIRSHRNFVVCIINNFTCL